MTTKTGPKVTKLLEHIVCCCWQSITAAKWPKTIRIGICCCYSQRNHTVKSCSKIFVTLRPGYIFSKQYQAQPFTQTPKFGYLWTQSNQSHMVMMLAWDWAWDCFQNTSPNHVTPEYIFPVNIDLVLYATQILLFLIHKHYTILLQHNPSLSF